MDAGLWRMAGRIEIERPVVSVSAERAFAECNAKATAKPICIKYTAND